MEIKTKADADKYLKETWSGSVPGPTATLETLLSNNGYFEIPHLIMTYTDFLSGLYSGKGPQSKNSDVRCFFRSYYPSKYHIPSAWLIYQYRHGLVHQYAPKKIRINDNETVGWSISLKPEGREEHLTLVPGRRATTRNLHLIASEFLKDFKRAVELFRLDVLTNSDRLQNLRKGYGAYRKPVPLDRIDRCSHYICGEDKEWLRQKLEVG